MKFQFDNRQEFNTPFKHLKRYAGVCISEPMKGAAGEFAEAQYSYPSFNEEAYGKNISVSEVEAVKVEYTQIVINKLDEQIKALQAMKKKLIKSIK